MGRLPELVLRYPLITQVTQNESNSIPDFPVVFYALPKYGWSDAHIVPRFDRRGPKSEDLHAIRRFLLLVLIDNNSSKSVSSFFFPEKRNNKTDLSPIDNSLWTDNISQRLTHLLPLLI